jgi:hypothetical protein
MVSLCSGENGWPLMAERDYSHFGQAADSVSPTIAEGRKVQGSRCREVPYRGRSSDWKCPNLTADRYSLGMAASKYESGIGAVGKMTTLYC